MARRGEYSYGSSDKETTNQKEGRSGSGTKKRMGPAVKSNPLSGNPTKGGGINRSTQGKSQE